MHVPAKFRENTGMRFWVTVRKLNVTDRRTDGQTDRRTDGRTDGGRCNISRPGPSAPREITRYKCCSQCNRRVANWFEKCCHCFVAKVYHINITQAHLHHTMECRCSSFGIVFAVDKVERVRVLISVKFNYMYFMTSLKMRSRLNLKRAYTTTMSL